MLPFLTMAQIIKLFAGGGSSHGSDGFGDGLHADSASIPDPSGGMFDKWGNYYVASALGGNRIRKIDTNGIITSIAGNGSATYNGDGGLADTSALNIPDDIAIDTFGNLFIADVANNRVRKIDGLTGFITTIAGTGAGSYSGDYGLATAASLWDPIGICLDKKGNIYIADNFNNRIRKINAEGIITTFAGTGLSGHYNGGGGLADTTALPGVNTVRCDKYGNIYAVCSLYVLKVDTFGIISTIAGQESGYIFNGDGIPATSAQIDPIGIAFDEYNNLFISDHLNFRVRMVDTNGIIHTVAGNGIAGTSGDGGPADSAEFNYPGGLAFDKCGNLYITDINPKLVRKVIYDSTCDPYSNLFVKATNYGRNFISTHPNPAVNELYVENVRISGQYVLFNITGIIEQAGTLQTGSNRIDIANLPMGLYILMLTTEDGQRVVRKVVKE